VGGPLCDTVLNIHASTKDKTDEMKDTFYEESESVFPHFWGHCHLSDKVFVGVFSGANVFIKYLTDTGKC
jgi:hypothetical protein